MKSIRNTVSFAVVLLVSQSSVFAMQDAVHPAVPLVESVAQVIKPMVQSAKQAITPMAQAAKAACVQRAQQFGQWAKPAAIRAGKALGIGTAGTGAGALGVQAYAKTKTAKTIVQPVTAAVAAAPVAQVAKTTLVDRVAGKLPFSETMNKKIVTAVPTVCAHVAAAAGAGTLGYVAAGVAARGTVDKCLVGAATVAAGAASLTTLGSYKTAALGAATAAGWIAHNRIEINDLVRKWSAGERAPVNGAQFFRWELNQWPTSKNLRENEQAVITQLQTDIAGVNGSFELEHELMPGENPHNTQVTWRDVLRYIEQELTTIKTDRLYLEDKYLTYMDFWPALYTGFGIKRRYNALCKSAGVTEITPGEFQDAHYWTVAQNGALRGRLPEELYAPKSLLGRLIQYSLKPNFGTAAELWWYLKGLQSRLEELERFVKKLGANTVSAPLPAYCACGRWAQPGARGCLHEQVGNTAGFVEAYAPRPLPRR